MKRFLLLMVAIGLTATTQAQKPSRGVVKTANRVLESSLEQATILYSLVQANPDLHPRTVKDGKLVTANVAWWTSGFFPGTLWYLSEFSQEMDYIPNHKAKVMADEMTRRTLVRQYATNDHDVGFQINCSAGNGYRLTDVDIYRTALITASKSLATRFNAEVGLTRSWNNKLWTFPVIIDNMMNMELLCVGAALSGDMTTYQMAIAHSKRTMEEFYRPDNSSYHLVDFNPETGEVIKAQTRQGYADTSAWARGQAWGLYGYTMMYRFTGDKLFLDHAVSIAEFMINHPNMPKDMIPYWDYDAPDIPKASRDVSAAAVMASALVELSTFLPEQQGQRYCDIACKQVTRLAKRYRTKGAERKCGFILAQSVGFMAKDSEVDAPLTYADYYFVEALMRLKKLRRGEPLNPDYASMLHDK